jgi:hypothetical protein
MQAKFVEARSTIARLTREKEAIAAEARAARAELTERAKSEARAIADATAAQAAMEEHSKRMDASTGDTNQPSHIQQN